MSLVVIDGDLISYMASAACEDRYIAVTHKKSGNSKQWGTRTLFKKWLSENPKWSIDDFEIVDKRNVEELSHCLHTVKAMIKNIVMKSGCKDFKIVMEGKDNFRDNILLPSKYKSNRKDSLKPELLGEARDYLKRKYNAELANGWETDDVLSSYAYEGYRKKKKIVQATVDKDAMQCQGWLFNWNKMESPEYISGLGELQINSKGKVVGNGRKWLYFQWCSGDPSDGYKPSILSGNQFGEKGCLKLLEGCKTDKDCLIAINNLYKSWYPEEFEYKAWNEQTVESNYKHQMQMYLDCARMRRWEGDIVVVEEMYDKMGIPL